MNNPEIAVIGLGYVGLPLSVLLSKNFKVVGFENNNQKVEGILIGKVTIKEPGLEDQLIKALESGNFTPTNKPDFIRKARVKIITVGTPYDKNSDSVDYSQLESSLEILENRLNVGDVIILKSTVPPGTTSGLVKKRISEYGFKVPEEIGLVFSPERIVEGQAISDYGTLPKIIGATDENSFLRASNIFSKLGGKMIKVSSPEAAETVKMVDNYSRFVFLGLTNEIALLCEKLGVDALEIIAAAKENYPRNAGILKPGPGVGGSCLNKDPFILRSEMRKNGLQLSMVESAVNVNYSMPGHIVELVNNSADGRKSVCVLGVAFKGNTDDTRFTPAEQVVSGLKKIGFSVVCHDPYVSNYLDLEIVNSLEEALCGRDIVILLTDHEEYRELDLSFIVKNSEKPLLIDTRGFIDRDTARKLGIEYHGLGRL